MPKAKQHEEVGTAQHGTATDQAADRAGRAHAAKATPGTALHGDQASAPGRHDSRTAKTEPSAHVEAQGGGATKTSAKHKQSPAGQSGKESAGADQVASTRAGGAGGTVTVPKASAHETEVTGKAGSGSKTGHGEKSPADVEPAHKTEPAHKAEPAHKTGRDGAPGAEKASHSEARKATAKATVQQAHAAATATGDGPAEVAAGAGADHGRSSGKAASVPDGGLAAGEGSDADAREQEAPKAPTETKKAKGRAKPEPEAVPAAVAPVEMTPERALFLDHQRELLAEERNNYMRQAEELRAQAAALALEHEPGDVQFDEEGGEGGTANVDRELDLHLSAQAQAAIEEIDAALAKIDAGTYGICESCGKPIPEARLEALPHARLCVTCKSGGLTARRQ